MNKAIIIWYTAYSLFVSSNITCCLNIFGLRKHPPPDHPVDFFRKFFSFFWNEFAVRTLKSSKQFENKDVYLVRNFLQRLFGTAKWYFFHQAIARKPHKNAWIKLLKHSTDGFRFIYKQHVVCLFTIAVGVFPTRTSLYEIECPGVLR